MTNLLIILAILACAVLAFFVLVQKPKGGGLSGSFGSVGNQVMGVQKSGDVMEKGTWYTMAIIAILVVGSTFTLGVNASRKAAQQEAAAQQQQAQQQQQQQPAQ
ncbi:MAG: preprotein translocase subunit SecG [Bacteroidetes bacterium 43-16]|nr:MAG: preprotein translocase subunit SecG [Bacteroidetes bacterium 43-16]